MRTTKVKNKPDAKELADQYSTRHLISNMWLYAFLSCGIILIGVGIYTAVSLKPANTVTFPHPEPRDIYISGPFYILLGMICSAYPAYRLIKQRFSKK